MRFVRHDTRIPHGHRLLHGNRTAHRIDDAGKPHQHTVANGLEDAAAVLSDFRIDELMAQRF